MSQPLFGLVPAGLPMLMAPTETLSPTSLIFSIPTGGTRPFRHLAVFLLPGVTLPPATAAAIYLVGPPAPGSSTPTSVFLGGVGQGKESAIFRLPTPPPGAEPAALVVIGISIEDEASVATRAKEIAAGKPGAAAAGAMVQVGGPPTTLVLAQRIIRNAFNFLASFSGQAGQVEVVPLRAFEEWWRKFESRVRSDPGFLERDD